MISISRHTEARARIDLNAKEVQSATDLLLPCLLPHSLRSSCTLEMVVQLSSETRTLSVFVISPSTQSERAFPASSSIAQVKVSEQRLTTIHNLLTAIACHTGETSARHRNRCFCSAALPPSVNRRDFVRAHRRRVDCKSGRQWQVSR